MEWKEEGICILYNAFYYYNMKTVVLREWTASLIRVRSICFNIKDKLIDFYNIFIY